MDIFLLENNRIRRNIWKYTEEYISTKAGTIFKGLVVNRHTAAGTVTVYDNASANSTPIATITAGATVLSDPPIAADYNITCTAGLRVVTTGASTDVTII